MNSSGDSLDHSGRPVVPVGVFGPRFNLRNPQLLSELKALVGQIEGPERMSLASYLRNGAMVIPFMEFTEDLLSNSFGVPGGSAILTDGLYFWRRDAAEYVETYGVGVPLDFVEHARTNGWVPAHVSIQDVTRIHDVVAELLRRPNS